tara:strand:+ start:376 stop:990 length:615 start_codon:yes stop_codon:yes gene_type:complete
MNTLSEKSRNNLKIIKNLGNDSILSSSSSRDIIIQEEFVEVDNINDLENGLFFTFHQCLSDMVNMEFLEKDTLINDIEECIQNIFDNKKLNSLMDEDNEDNEDNELYGIMTDIDLKLDLLKESYYYGSPFYKYYTKYCLIKDYINNIIEDPPCYGLVKFFKEYNKYVTKLNKQYSDSDSSGSSEDEGGDEGEDEGGSKCDNKFE